MSFLNARTFSGACRQAMVWLVNAGWFGIIIAYAFVALSFLVLRDRESATPGPYAVECRRFTGGAALLSSPAVVLPFLPGSPAALVRPYEWAIVGGWSLRGAALVAVRPG